MYFLRSLSNLALISFIGVATSYTVNQDCGSQRDTVNRWIVEARFLFDRAAKVLAGSQPPNGGGFSPNVKKIAQSCLGAGVADSDLLSIQNTFNTIVQNLGSKNSDGPDIDFRCTNPQRYAVGNFPTSTDPSGTQSTTRALHPVPLSRIQGTEATGPNSAWFANDPTARLYLNPIANLNGQTNLAFTYQPSTHALSFQKQITSSDHLWCDIVLNKILEEVSTVKGTFQEAVPNWGIAALNSARFSILTQDPASITIMHELTHSIAMGPGNDISGHARIGSSRVTGIDRVFRAAQEGVPDLARNPDTLAWLAVLLCMPWFKWTDDSQTPPVIDGVARWNTYESNGVPIVDMPRFLRDRIGTFDDQDTGNLARGPYAYS